MYFLLLLCIPLNIYTHFELKYLNTVYFFQKKINIKMLFLEDFIDYS